jgi:hypothetical protein
VPGTDPLEDASLGGFIEELQYLLVGGGESDDVIRGYLVTICVDEWVTIPV